MCEGVSLVLKPENNSLQIVPETFPSFSCCLKNFKFTMMVVSKLLLLVVVSEWILWCVWTFGLHEVALQVLRQERSRTFSML